MHVIVVASRKGGAGKTTLAGHLAVQAERQGNGPVALLDTDPQGSLADWWNLRAAPAPHYLHTTMDELPYGIAQLREQGFALLIVDTPPALTTAIGDVIGRADLVVIPIRPSPHDLRSVGTTVKLVEHLGTPLIFVVNAAPPRARITADAITLLSRHGPLAPSIIHQRVDFASSMIDGRTVMEVSGKSRSALEIVALWSYLKDRLQGSVRRTAMPALPGVAAEEGAAPAIGASGA
ncbi:MAG: ParA family protein [Kiloniellales bacterium]